jgi:hypothetical protein
MLILFCICDHYHYHRQDHLVHSAFRTSLRSTFGLVEDPHSSLIHQALKPKTQPRVDLRNPPRP